jgi:DNA-binding PadR family transcriptional regulator
VAKPVVEAQNLTKSCNEALILACLAGGPKHGYQLALEIERRSDGIFKFNHGTLYPILHKLEKDGLIEGRWSNEGQKRKRKSYTITRKGAAYAREQHLAWRAFIDRFLNLVGGMKK